MLHQAHRAQAFTSLRKDLSVSLSSSSMSDRTGRPVGDRSGRPGEHRNSEAQIRTLLDDQREQILAECQARFSQHEFQAARAEEEQRLLQGQLLQQNLELREAHQRNLTEMEELRKFQSSTFDTMARRKLVEDQNTTLELSGRRIGERRPYAPPDSRRNSRIQSQLVDSFKQSWFRYDASPAST